ncbi:hypothetical protein EXT46_12875 [Pseudoalteromonas sp. CO325X]|uniref:hypothetical protein n=1 Tax=Pseudoalteromonas sp. CO325X TaxID=1777262 RepID=UPI001023A9BD|nr:hypothetical protein [Pseudoalteromonas sp. CO325X]RZF80187.1 hypothetical protein EXT46_12875 [Pseudoalteromonas sp. CO325X]
MPSQNDEDLKLVHIPALVAVLLNAETKKGAPLTEQEVLGIRDSSQCMAMPLDVAVELAEERGYADIDPENAWDEWQSVRLELLYGT